ncbi:MAG: sulfurtransferase TusA family protein [Myxococcaceae bacterium]|nr:sulfurtransferase TusA family protein [Myxococcaceae bacterium]
MSEEVSPFQVDARGRACPWPIIELAKALRLHPLVELRATDPATRGDLMAFCDATGAGLLEARVDQGVLTALVRRAGPATEAPANER